MRLIAMGPLGIWGPMLVVLLCLWLGRGDRSHWFVKVILFTLLGLLLLIMLGYS